MIATIFLAGCTWPGGPTLQPTLSAEQVYQTAGITIVPSQTPALPTASPTPNPTIHLRGGFHRLYGYPESGYPLDASLQTGDVVEVIAPFRR